LKLTRLSVSVLNVIILNYSLTYLLISQTSERSILKLTDLSVSSRHISPPFFVSSVTEIPGNSSLIFALFSFSHRKYADCALFGLSGSTSFFGYQSINQPINQSTNQSINQSSSQSINPSINQSINHRD